jgi:peptidoglycan/LPS O-acetylase OafA/YrhL
MTETEGTKVRLESLELGRFLAAILVASFHYTETLLDLRNVTVFDRAFRGGHAGVEYFFVLSGFIIYFTHWRDLGNRGRLPSFAVKRAIRLYPAYLVVFALMAAASYILPGVVDAKISFPWVMPDALLLPIPSEPVLGVSWTLRREVIFYAIFAVLIWRPALGGAIFAFWQIGSLLVPLMRPELGEVWKPFADIYNFGFAAGVGIAWLVLRCPARHPTRYICAGSVALIILLALEWRLGRHLAVPGLALGKITSPLLYIAACALVIYGGASRDMVVKKTPSSVIACLGGSSYVLYLTHNPIGSLVARIAAGPPVLTFAIMIAAALTASIVAHLFFEKPALNVLRKVFFLGNGSGRSMPR